MSCLQFLLVDDQREYDDWLKIWNAHVPSDNFALKCCDLQDRSQVGTTLDTSSDQAIAWCTDDAKVAFEVIEHHAELIHGFFIDVNLGNHPLGDDEEAEEIAKAVSGLDGNVDGLRLALRAKWRNPNAFVVVVTACDPGANMEKVATANASRIDLWVEKNSKATLYFSLRRAWDHARALLLSAPPVQGVVGLAEELSRVRRYTQGSLMEPILITGETGTGKEVIAQSVFRMIKSRGENHSDTKCRFIPLNCAAIPDSIIESELFGAVKGAYTGADRNRNGAFIEAGTGVLFLDEIGELPEESQAKLLRALETREIQRLGDPKPVRVSARIVAATHRNLADMVRGKAFREDLFYRLSTLPIEIPPLRSRRDDIRPLVDLSLAECGRVLSRRFTMAEEGYEVLRSYDWPGNVRQLQKSILRICVLNGTVDAGPKIVRISKAEVQCEVTGLRRQNLYDGMPGAEALALDSKAVFEYWLKERNDSRAMLSHNLGIDRRQLNKILKHLGFDEGTPGRKSHG